MNPLFRCCAIVFAWFLLLGAADVQAQRRAIRVDLGEQWRDAPFASKTCAGADLDRTVVMWGEHVFVGLDDPSLLEGAYCSVSRGSRFSGSMMPADEADLAALIGPNRDGAVTARRFTFLNDPERYAATHGFQWMLVSFPGDFTIVGLYGLQRVKLDETTFVSERTKVLWDSAGDRFDGEYFCFQGQKFVGTWNPTRPNKPSPCAKYLSNLRRL
jgi:hypothetical protein